MIVKIYDNEIWLEGHSKDSHRCGAISGLALAYMLSASTKADQNQDTINGKDFSVILRSRTDGDRVRLEMIKTFLRDDELCPRDDISLYDYERFMLSLGNYIDSLDDQKVYNTAKLRTGYINSEYFNPEYHNGPMMCLDSLGDIMLRLGFNRKCSGCGNIVDYVKS